MANTLTRFYTGQPTTDFSTLYTVPAVSKIIIKDIVACNATTVAAAALTLSLVPVAAGTTGVAGSSNAILFGSTFSINESKFITGSWILSSTGDTIQAKATTSATITLFISGMVVT